MAPDSLPSARDLVDDVVESLLRLGGRSDRQSVIKGVVEHGDFTAGQRAEPVHRAGARGAAYASELHYRAGWALSHAKEDGLADNDGGIWALTERVSTYQRINRLRPLDLRNDALEGLRRLGGEAQRTAIIRNTLEAGGWSEDEIAVRSRIRQAAQTFHLATLADHVIATLRDRGEVESVGGGRWRLTVLGEAALRPSFGVPYRPPPRSAAGSRGAVDLKLDLDELDRRTDRHMDLQDELQQALASRGFDTRSPAPGEPEYDLAFTVGEETWLVEVKTVGSTNQTQQFRLGLGQIVEYRYRVADAMEGEVRVAFLVESVPKAEWAAIAESVEVTLLDESQIDDFVAGLTLKQAERKST
jgi:hypothetical protein